jgi:hypothetical protein
VLVEVKTCFLQGQNLQKLAGLYSAFKLQTLSTWVSWKLASSPRHNYCAAGKNNIMYDGRNKRKITAKKHASHNNWLFLVVRNDTKRPISSMANETCFSS